MNKKSIIGIDSGSSFVKIINIDVQGNIINKLMLERMTIDEAIEIFINKVKIDKSDILKFVVTGVKQDEVEQIYGIETIKVDEFVAIGAGGLFLSNQEEGLVVSIGTGTAFIEAKSNSFKHIGGTGVGGGTLINLCKKFGNVNSFNEINEAIKKGNLRNIDLTIQDVSTHEIETLPKDTTSANFGNLSEKASKEDIILGISNMVFETIGIMAVFATQNINTKNIIVIGNVATMPYLKIVFEKIEKLHNVKFIIPKEAEFATAIGAIKSAI